MAPTLLDRRAPVAAPLAVGLAAAGAFAYVGLVDPNAAGHYPACPFLALTGWYCPGCGSLRAMHALAHHDVPAAFALNPLSTSLLPVLLGLWLAWLVAAARGRPVRLRAPAWAVWGVVGLVVAFGVLRNLPGLQVLAP